MIRHNKSSEACFSPAAIQMPSICSSANVREGISDQIFGIVNLFDWKPVYISFVWEIEILLHKFLMWDWKFVVIDRPVLVDQEKQVLEPVKGRHEGRRLQGLSIVYLYQHLVFTPWATPSTHSYSSFIICLYGSWTRWFLPLRQNEVACDTIHAKMSSAPKVHLDVNQFHFYIKSFALGIALKGKHKVTSKWPVIHSGSAK